MVEEYHNTQLLKTSAFSSFSGTSAFFSPVIFYLGKGDSPLFETQNQATGSKPDSYF